MMMGRRKLETENKYVEVLVMEEEVFNGMRRRSRWSKWTRASWWTMWVRIFRLPSITSL